jgi:hypothetical protein
MTPQNLERRARCRNPTRFVAPVAALATAVLAACSMPAAIRPGEDAASVRQRLGSPDAVHVAADGTSRLEYTRGPFGQTTWMIDVDLAGTVTRIEQVRTFENFGRLKPEVDDQKSVRREFGAPWKVEYYGPSRLTAWLYPYRESGVYNSMMAVMFDPRGIYQRAENGPDPRFLANDKSSRD